MSKGLTRRQQEIMEIITEHIKRKGYAPTYQELEKDSSARALRVVHPDFMPANNNEYELPLIGRVAAGYPILAQENVERYVSIPRAMVKAEGRYFALKVRGDSMINAGIFEDDIVVVLAAQSAYNRDIVVALVDDEVTVKRLIRDGGQTYLKAENPDYEDIYPQGQWSIQGKVVGLIREMAN